MEKEKAKELLERWDGYFPHAPVDKLKYEDFLATKEAAALLSGEDWKEDGNSEWARKLYDNLHHIFHQYSDEWSGYQEQATEKLLTEYESFAKNLNQ